MSAVFSLLALYRLGKRKKNEFKVNDVGVWFPPFREFRWPFFLFFFLKNHHYEEPQPLRLHIYNIYNF